MRATIDKAGRVVIPAPLRERLDLRPGPVEVSEDGLALRIEPIPRGRLVKEGELLVVTGDGEAPSTEQIRELRLGDQR